jgi:hypothetical protein
MAFCQSFDERPDLHKKLLASFDLLPHILVVELCEFDIIAFLPITEQPVVEIAMLPSKLPLLMKCWLKAARTPLCFSNRRPSSRSNALTA